MPKRTRGIYDPDYRKAGWSQSKYAPKNSTTSLSQTAAIPAGMILLFVYGAIPYLWPESRQVLYSIGGIAVGFFGFMVVWAITARILRRREEVRLRKQHGLRSEAELRSPERLESRINAKVRFTSAKQFEHEVATLLSLYTKHRVEVVGGASDGGVDLTITTEDDRLVGIVQCKQYREDRTLPPVYIRELATVKNQRKVSIAYLVTTARFSQASKTEASQLGVKLIDGAALADMKAKRK